jgi:hypothetical protein
MTKRQRRIPGDLILQSLPEIPKFPVNVIMRNGQVFYLQILKIKDLSLEVSDMRNSKKQIHIRNIAEIIVDI